MSAKYTIHRDPPEPYYCVLNPSGRPIAFNCSWRVARKIADLYNADVERRRTKVRRITWVPHKSTTSTSASNSTLSVVVDCGAVSLQEEA